MHALTDVHALGPSMPLITRRQFTPHCEALSSGTARAPTPRTLTPSSLTAFPGRLRRVRHESPGRRVQVTEEHTLTTKKSVTLGLNPISLSAFRMNGCPYVFAATDRPAVVHEHNGKLVYSPLNESNVAHLCTFSTEALPGAVAMCKDDRLMITAIDAIQKLHIRCAPVPPLRIP